MFPEARPRGTSRVSGKQNSLFPEGPVIKCLLSFDYFKYYDEGMSQKDSRDDSQGPASTQKFNYLYLHFERGHSQHENIPINKPLKSFYRAFEIFHLKVYIYIIDQARGQDSWILASFSFCVFLTERNDRTSLVNKGFIIWHREH